MQILEKVFQKEEQEVKKINKIRIFVVIFKFIN